MKAQTFYKNHCQTQPDDPDTSKIHKAWNKSITCATKCSCCHDRCSKQWFRQKFDTKYLCRQRPYGWIRCQYPEYNRTDQHHDRSGCSHEACTHRCTDIPIPFCLFCLTCTHASPNQCCCRRPNTISRHIAQTLRCHCKRICRNRNSAQWGDDHCGCHHRTVYGYFLHCHRRSDPECSL